MSISTDANASAIRRTSGAFVDEEAFTFCTWIYGTNFAGPANFGVLFAVNDETGGGAWTNANLFAISDTSQLQHVNDAFDQDVLISSLPEDVWLFVAGRRDGTNIKGWYRRITDSSFTTGTNTTAANTFTPAAHWAIGDDDLETSESQAFRWMKVWNAVLTDDEVEREFYSARPQRTANLIDFLPLQESVTTIENFGSGGDWTELTGANLDTVDNEPPIAWGGEPITNEVAVSISVEQESFRFRNDDGSESAATWKAAQDVNASVGIDEVFRLRFLLNATGDPAAQSYQLEYRKVGAASWTKVPLDE